MPIKLPVYRIRALDTELAEILQEADTRCSTAFALRLDDLREKLVLPLESVAKSQARIVRRHADQDAKGNPVRDEKTGSFIFSTAAQQEKVSDELAELMRSELEIDDLPKLKKTELVANGLATSGLRISNLRPILDVSEPDEPATRSLDERTVHIGSPKRLPDA